MDRVDLVQSTIHGKERGDTKRLQDWGEVGEQGKRHRGLGVPSSSSGRPPSVEWDGRRSGPLSSEVSERTLER